MPLSRQPADKTILQSLSHPLGLTVVADEGDETEELEGLDEEADSYAAWLDFRLPDELTH